MPAGASCNYPTNAASARLQGRHFISNAPPRHRSAVSPLIDPPKARLVGASRGSFSSNGQLHRTSRHASAGSHGPPLTAQGSTKERHRLTFSYLQMLWAVVHLCGVEPAAASYNLKQASFKRELKKMEQSLGVPLFIEKPKDHRPGLLTDAGNVLLYYSEQILMLAFDAQQAVSDLRNTRTGALSLGASQAAHSLLLSGLAGSFMEAYPQVEVDVTVADTRSVCAAVAAGRLDSGLVSSSVPRDLKGALQSLHVATEELLLLVHAKHPLSSAGKISLKQLYDIPFFVYSEGSHWEGAFDSALSAAGVDSKLLGVRAAFNSVAALKEMLAMSKGAAAFLPASAVSGELARGELVGVPVAGRTLTCSMYLVVDPRRYCSQMHRAFLSHVFDLDIVCELQTSISEDMLPLQANNCKLRQGTPRGLEWPGEEASEADDGPLEEAEEENVKKEEEEQQQQQDDPAFEMARGSILRLMRDQRGLQITEGPSLFQGGARRQLMQRLPFKLGELELFHATAKSGTLSKAAAKYGVSISTVTLAIQRLERVLGVELVVRWKGKSTIATTPVGKLLEHYSHELLELLDEAMMVLKDIRDVRTGSVRLGASQTTGTYLVPRLIGAFRLRNPYIGIHLQVDSSRRICEAVAAGEVDVALIGSQLAPGLEKMLVATPYSTDELVLIVSRQHPLSASSSIDKDVLYNLQFVSISEGSEVQAMQARVLKHHGINWNELRVEMEFNSVEAIKSAVRFNLGVAFVSVLAIEKELELGLLVQVPVRGMKLLRTLYLVSNPASYVSPAASKFMEEVLELNPRAQAPTPEHILAARLRLSGNRSRLPYLERADKAPPLPLPRGQQWRRRGEEQRGDSRTDRTR
mmetsp:Transcript_6191/g.17303  ORF Transcript_6191/g.17303 Transcript_6191/m.17303 type:complete len:863 (+) Transcript_6191:193-2781(+)